MKQALKELILDTTKERELINITSQVENFIADNRIKDGICLIYSLHATAGIIINENEKNLLEDFLDNIRRLLPDKLSYKHNAFDDNAASHIGASLLSQGQTLVIRDGQLQRGTWQDIFFLELDGPRTGRRVLIKIIGQ